MPAEETTPQENFMLTVGGKRFRCACDDAGRPCGGNVFHKSAKPGGYVCNACGSAYIGEPLKESAGG